MNLADAQRKWELAIQRFNINPIYKDKVFNTELLTDKLRYVGPNWVKNASRKSLFLHGCAGSGKTFYALQLLKSLIIRDIWVIYVRSDDLDHELLEAQMNGLEMDTIRKYKEVPILFIDDLGVERPTDRLRTQFCKIFDYRHETGVTVCTSNLRMDQLPDILGDRIASRLSNFYEVEFPERDLRKKD